MTSKISYIKFISADIRHRAWFPALCCISLFLLMPVYSFLYLDSMNVTAEDLRAGSWLYTSFAGMLNGDRFFPLCAALFALALLAAVSGFSYIHSREKLDFYHSLPLKRSQWFLINYAGGLLSFLVPYVVCALLSLAAGYSAGIVNGANSGDFVLAVLGGVLAFLLIYHAGILAAVLTGTVIAQAVAFFVLCVYPTIVLTLFTSLQETFFDSCYYIKDSLSAELTQLLSPVELFNRILSDTAAAELSVSLPVCLVFAALLASAACILYRAYPSEAAGNALSFPATAPFFKIFVCIPTALYAGIFICMFTGVSDTDWVFVLSILMAVLLCGIIEYLYQQDLRLLFKNWRSSLIAVAGVLAVLCVMRFDLAGYDTYLPEQKNTESVSFTPDSFSYYFMYPEQNNLNSPVFDLFAPEEYTPMLLELAREGIDNLEHGITPEAVDTGDSRETSGCINAVFQYRLKNGRTVVRRYPLQRESVLNALTRLFENEDFRRELFPIFHVDTENLLAAALRDLSGSEKTLSLTTGQRAALIDAYKQDVLTVGISALESSSPIGELLLVFPYQNVYDGNTTLSSVPSDMVYTPYSSDTETISNFYIYPEYENTLACLEEFGYSLDQMVPADNISELLLFITPESFRSGKFDSLLEELSLAGVYSEDELSSGITLTDSESIRMIAGRLVWDAPEIVENTSRAEDFAEITYKNGWSSSYYLQ